MKHKFFSSRMNKSGFDEPEVNPMDGVSNLSDAMLILAVGIMLALVINWNVDISPALKEDKPQQDAIELNEDDMQSADDKISSDSEMQEMGTVYYDEASGKYYIIKNSQ